MLTRVAASHIRVGTFQYFAARGDAEAVRLLADYAIARHYPEAAGAERPYRALLDGVVARQAELVARWLLVGFVHGVMNTDNTSIAGETIDYGPCAFLDAYDPAAVFSSIDHFGRYAYGNQPRIAQWNLARLAEACCRSSARTRSAALAAAQESLAAFAPRFEAAYVGGLRRKIGLSAEREGDAELAQDLLGRMAENGADFTLAFRRLCDAAARAGGRRGRARPLHGRGRLRRLGGALAPAAGRGARGAGGAPRRHAGGEPGLDPAQPPGGGGAQRRRGARGLRPVRGTARGPVAALRGQAGLRALRRAARSRRSACSRPSAAPEATRRSLHVPRRDGASRPRRRP